MKKVIFIATLLMAIACEQTPKNNVAVPEPEPTATVTPVYQVKVVKQTKEISDTYSDTERKYDWFAGKFRLVPVVKTRKTYYVAFTDGTTKEISKEQFISLKEGDTLKF